MAVNDHTSKPSDRLIKAVSSYFNNKGFAFQKKRSLNYFERPFEYGSQSIRLEFYTHSSLVKVSLAWSVHFDKLSKLIGKLYEDIKWQKCTSAIGESLGIYTRWMENVEHAWPLYDQDSLQHDDVSINKAGKKLIEAYEHFVEPYFEKNSNYTGLANFMLEAGYDSEAALIVAKFTASPKYESILSQRYMYANNRSGEDKESALRFLHNWERFESQGDLNLALK
jgi:hypothetical protein